MIGRTYKISLQKKTWKSWLYIIPSLAGTIIFVGIPFLDIIRRSFLSAMGNEFVGLYNYIVVWQNRAFQLALKNNLLFLSLGVPLLMLTSFFTALLVQSSGKKKNLYKTTLVLPMAIPVASICLIWKIFFLKDGLLNEVILSFYNVIKNFINIPDYKKVNWIEGNTAFGILLFTFLWKNLGYNMLLWLAGLNGIADSVYEAAKLDGANNWAIMRYIVIPELTGTAGVVFVLSIINSFRIYREAYLIAGSYPHESIYMLQHLFNHWFLNMDVQNMSTAASTITMGTLLCILACFIYSKIRQRGKNETF